HLLVKVRTTEPAGSQGAVESEQTRDDAGPFDRADVVVALGPCDNLDAQQVEPAAGDWLVATGEAGRVNDRPVLVADRAQVNGREILGVDQHERFHLIEGRVMDVGDARYDPRSAPARLVRLQSPDGETRVADL